MSPNTCITVSSLSGKAAAATARTQDHSASITPRSLTKLLSSLCFKPSIIFRSSVILSDALQFWASEVLLWALTVMIPSFHCKIALKTASRSPSCLVKSTSSSYASIQVVMFHIFLLNLSHQCATHDPWLLCLCSGYVKSPNVCSNQLHMGFWST